MQTLDNINNTDDSVTKIELRNIKRKDFTMPKRVGLFTFALTASLLLATGCARDEPITNTPPAEPRASELEHIERNVQQRPTPPPNSNLENTERNVRDSGGATLTPEDQGANRGDREITAAIRRTIVKDKSLSLNAHNAKIITRNGVVTLRGPVKNAAEKNTLQSIAKKIRGVKQVDNQLEIKAP